MINLYVIEKSATARSGLTELIAELLHSDHEQIRLLPRIDVKPVSPQELEHHALPDIALLGPDFLSSDINYISSVANKLTGVPSLAMLPEQLDNLMFVERLSRLGIRNTVEANPQAHTFLSRLIQLTSGAKEKSPGKLVLVDGGSGVGVTSIVAALGEGYASEEKKVALVDADFDTQALSRFLQARPFLNETLQQILTGNHPCTQEYVRQCCGQIWADEENISIVPPVPALDGLITQAAPMARTYLSALEVVCADHDVTLLDSGTARGGLLQTLYRVADSIIFVLSPDPASVYGGVAKLESYINNISPNSKVFIVTNETPRPALSHKNLKSKLKSLLLHPQIKWVETPIPFCKNASAWPASGASMASLGSQATKKSLEQLRATISLFGEKALADSSKDTILKKSFGALKKYNKRKKLQAPKRKELPAATAPLYLDEPAAKETPRLPESDLLSAPTIRRSNENQDTSSMGVVTNGIGKMGT
ncbi:MAG: AAA family ATPase [Bdellovibrionales bacterium]|nr:AAA family ATPase [Bdellovibrionales bacterium]